MDQNTQNNATVPMKALDTHVHLDEVADKLSGYFQSTKKYVEENPRESAVIALGIGLAAWTLLYTRPGRRVFELGTLALMPQISNWLSQNLSAKETTRH